MPRATVNQVEIIRAAPWPVSAPSPPAGRRRSAVAGQKPFGAKTKARKLVQRCQRGSAWVVEGRPGHPLPADLHHWEARWPSWPDRPGPVPGGDVVIGLARRPTSL
jgi:hypothetical protein